MTTLRCVSKAWSCGSLVVGASEVVDGMAAPAADGFCPEASHERCIGPVRRRDFAVVGGHDEKIWHIFGKYAIFWVA